MHCTNAGSTISAANKAVSKKGETDWASLLAKWISSAFKGRSITVRNGAIAGTTSEQAVACLEKYASSCLNLTSLPVPLPHFPHHLQIC